MAADTLEHKGLQKLLKSHPDEPTTFYADKLGIDRSKIGPMIWFNEPIVDSSLKMPATKASIVKARQGGMRWERIACRTGKSIAEVKEIGGKEADVYVGRGARFDGSTSNGKKAASKGGKAAKGKATSGRRAAAAKGKNSKGGGKPRARTRAERAAKAGNPK